MILAGFATQSPLEVFMGFLMVGLFVLCIILAVNTLYGKIAKFFSEYLAAVREGSRVDITINEMYDSPVPTKKTGPEHPIIEGKAK